MKALLTKMLTELRGRLFTILVDSISKKILRVEIKRLSHSLHRFDCWLPSTRQPVIDNLPTDTDLCGKLRSRQTMRQAKSLKSIWIKMLHRVDMLTILISTCQLFFTGPIL